MGCPALSSYYQALFLHKQLIWALGAMLDTYISEQAVALEKKIRAAKRKGVPRSVPCGAGTLTVKDPFSHTPSGQNARVLAYWHAGRKAFEGVEVLGHAQDSSRVGGRSTMLQMVTGPKNQAMWLTPQAFGYTSKDPFLNTLFAFRKVFSNAFFSFSKSCFCARKSFTKSGLCLF